MTQSLPHTGHPPVSVVLPTLQERKWIRDCLGSLLAQDYPNIVEILVVDGGSTDGTRELAAGVDPRIQVLDNPRVTAASAMNIGMRAAKCDLVIRVDAHTIYERDYISRAVAVSQESGAAVAGGPMRPVGLTVFGRAVAAVTSSPFGVGPGRFHYSTEAADVDTVYLGAFRRQVVLEVGGYDETTLQWAAEDQELNYRIRQAGHRIRLDPSIRSWYFPRQTPTSLGRQYFNYGMCKASTLWKHHRLPSWRPVAPTAMVLTVLGALGFGALLGRPRLGTVPAVGYAAGASAVALRLGRAPGVAPHRVLAALSICHWSYGLGFLAGLGRIVTGRQFDIRPRRTR